MPGPERRRRWTAAEKHRIVEESLAADTTVVEVARRHNIHPNLLHLWGRQATAKLNDVDPQTWLADVLARIAGQPMSKFNELLPWNWQRAHARLTA
ncbi:transposase domain-containing protein [Rhodoligotrophos defluvii]|uniref:transposase domain-containing protein n=1 Tax=Rhodoligotrophos defluvii TaxID=2561934 RepID=UPI001EEF8900|nr:transposase [Rhodoligotrophos defluvii]